MEIKKYPLTIVFHKYGDIIYFSQLDLTRIFERALRRSGLPLYFTQGFNPRVKMSFAGGLKLGVEGRITATFYFIEPVSNEDLKSKLKEQLPEGLEVVQ